MGEDPHKTSDAIYFRYQFLYMLNKLVFRVGVWDWREGAQKATDDDAIFRILSWDNFYCFVNSVCLSSEYTRRRRKVEEVIFLICNKLLQLTNLHITKLLFPRSGCVLSLQKSVNWVLMVGDQSQGGREGRVLFSPCVWKDRFLLIDLEFSSIVVWVKSG